MWLNREVENVESAENLDSKGKGLIYIISIKMVNTVHKCADLR